MKRSPLSLELKLIDVRILHQASERVLVSCLLLSLERICRASNWCVQFVIPLKTQLIDFLNHLGLGTTQLTRRNTGISVSRLT